MGPLQTSNTVPADWQQSPAHSTDRRCAASGWGCIFWRPGRLTASPTLHLRRCLTRRVSKSDLRLLRLPGDAWSDLIGDHAPRRFKYVVGSTAFTQTWRVSLVLVDSEVVGAAVVRRYGRPGFRQDGLEFMSAEPFTNRCSWSSLVAGIPQRSRSHLDRGDGEALPPKAGAAVEDALNRIASGAGLVLARLRELIPRSTPLGNRGSILREQRDAVALGLEIAGMNSRELLGDDSTGSDDSDRSFLSGWIQRRVSEASTIRHDATAFDEWLPDQADNFDMATFRDPDDPARKVTVFYADKERLERQTGTDLLYYRHHRPGFILVQYKRMRTTEDRPASPTYYPDDQLRAELNRYRELPLAAPAATADDWRLTEDAYFVKLVRDDLRKPGENKLVRGMYLPLGLVDLLLKDAEDGRRPKGWSSESVTTYLSNEEFLQLAKQGYIGTRGAATEHLERVILGSFREGRGVVLTVDETDNQQAARLRHG